MGDKKQDIEQAAIDNELDDIRRATERNDNMKEFTYLQVDHICYQIGEWYLNWKDAISPGNEHQLGYAKEELKSMICGDKDERLQPPDENIKLNLNDSNSSYIGDGVYAHTDEHKRLWAVTYNGISITNQICLEPDVFSALVKYYERMKGNNERA